MREMGAPLRRARREERPAVNVQVFLNTVLGKKRGFRGETGREGCWHPANHLIWLSWNCFLCVNVMPRGGNEGQCKHHG